MLYKLFAANRFTDLAYLSRVIIAARCLGHIECIQCKDDADWDNWCMMMET